MTVFALFGLWLVPAFQAVTGGRDPIDLAFPVTPAVIHAEYAHYTAASRMAYRNFAVLDFLWPPLLALLLALGCAWLARRTASPWGPRLVAGGVLLLPFAEALLDLLENVGFLLLLATHPAEPAGLAWAKSIARGAKLLAFAACGLALLAFAALALFRPSGPPAPPRSVAG